MFATLAGALPVPPDSVRAREMATARGVPAGLPPADPGVVAAIALQAQLGLEPVTDGDLRGDPLTTTALGLEGVEAGAGGPGVIATRVVEWREPIHVARWRAAASMTDRAVKQIVGGPYSLGRRLGTGSSERVRRSLTIALAEALGAELRSLAEAGCLIVQVDEPEAVAIGDSPAEALLFGDAQRRLLDGLAGIHLSLCVTGGNADTAGPATFFDAPYASYLFDLIDGPDNWRLIARAPSDRGIVCGAVPAGDQPRVEKEVVVWAAHYAAATMGRGLVRVGLATSGSLAGVSWDEARERLELLASAAEIASEPGRRMAERLDPHAFKAAPRPPRLPGVDTGGAGSGGAGS